MAMSRKIMLGIAGVLLVVLALNQFGVVNIGGIFA